MEDKSTSLTVAVAVIEKVESNITSELNAAKSRIHELKRLSEAIIVNSVSSEAEITSVVIESKTILKAMEKKQDETAGILGKWARRLNAHFKPTADTVDAIIKQCGRKVGSYKNALEEARQAEIKANAERIAAEDKRLMAEKEEAAKKYLEQKRVAEAFDAPEIVELAAIEFQETMGKTNILIPEVVEKKSVVAGGSASVKAVRRYEIVDQFLLPRDFLIPDDKKIAEQVKAGVKVIPGVRIWEEMGFGRINVKKG